MKKLQVLYIAIFFSICLIPFVGMAITKQEDSSENRTLAEFPQIETEEGINVQWLSEAGEYFQEHFAYRKVIKLWGFSSAPMQKKMERFPYFSLVSFKDWHSLWKVICTFYLQAETKVQFTV